MAKCAGSVAGGSTQETDLEKQSSKNKPGKTDQENFI
jgi:hypothetical protein